MKKMYLFFIKDYDLKISVYDNVMHVWYRYSMHFYLRALSTVRSEETAIFKNSFIH